MSFSYPLFAPSTPYYTGDVSVIDAPALVVGLAGHTYPVDLREYRHRGLPAFREGVVTSNEPSDNLFDSQGAWWRYRFSWHHGAGQRVLDLDRDADDHARFWRSRGIDPWEKYQACLLPSTELVLEAAASNIMMVATATHVYVSDGNGVKRSADLSTWADITGMSNNAVVAMTTDGTNAYIANTANIYSVGTGSVAASSITSATPAASFNALAFVGNRLLVGDGADLAEVGASALTSIYEHFQAAFRWTAVFQVGSRIYVGGFAGNRSELFTVVTTEDGTLAVSAEAATFFAGELLRTALSYGGSVILATSKGVRFAALGGDGTLSYGPLIDVAGDARCITAEGRFAWFGWEDFPDAGCGVGRLALDTFVDTLTPAYATDVFTEDEDDTITACCRFGGRTLFAVSGEGVWATTTDGYVTNGYIDVGEVFFGTVEDKSIAEVRAKVNELETDETLSITVTAEDGSVLATGTAQSPANGVAVNAQGQVANRVGILLELAGDGTSTACLRQWRARAYPIAPGIEEWLVPLIIQSRVIDGDGEGTVYAMDPFAEVERIKEKWQSREVVVYQEGDHAWRVRIDNFVVTPVDWRDGGDWFELTCTVRLLSV